MEIGAVVVFCGVGDGPDPSYMQEAEKMGALLAKHKIKLIYGAGAKGMMGAVAKGAAENDGYVVGATIRSLYEREKAELVEDTLKQFEVWDKMSSRKVSMTKQADAICVLPGGLGTMDELFEMMVLRQIQIIEKPIVVVNTHGYYNTFKKMLQEMVEAKFMREDQLNLIQFVDTVDDALPVMYAQAKQIEAMGEK